jgi:hypothetical protein
MKGGGFTANQLHDIFLDDYSNKDYEIYKSTNLEILNKTNDKLYNSTFKVFFDRENIRFVVVHRGTDYTLTDWTNNLRNATLGNVKSDDAIVKQSLTKRQITAEEGHKHLKEYLVKLYNSSATIQKKYSFIFQI